jgi:hypothetical protein
MKSAASRLEDAPLRVIRAAVAPPTLPRANKAYRPRFILGCGEHAHCRRQCAIGLLPGCGCGSAAGVPRDQSGACKPPVRCWPNQRPPEGGRSGPVGLFQRDWPRECAIRAIGINACTQGLSKAWWEMAYLHMQEARRCPDRSNMPSLSAFSPPQSDESADTAKQNSPQRQQLRAP